MAKQFLNLHGLELFLTKLHDLFVTPEEVSQVVDETEMFVTNVDYSQIAFDVEEIITKEET